MTDNTRERVQAVKGGPSEAAKEAAGGAWGRTVYENELLTQRSESYLAADALMVALDAAHDPALGLDRSVRLGDVVEWLRDPKGLPFHLLANGDEFARRVAREFGTTAHAE